MKWLAGYLIGNTLACAVACQSNRNIHRKRVNATADTAFASIMPSRKIEWTPCYQNSSAAEVGALSCTRLIAPLDLNNETAGEIQLAIIKLAAMGTTSPRTVFFNPGGPGDDPVDKILTDAAILRAQVGSNADILAIVPRAVSWTSPAITCDASDVSSMRRESDINAAQPGYTDRSINESFAIGKSLRIDCALNAEDLYPYAGTYYAAHDMDYVLQALGQQKMSYIGYSYGTVLGGTYAALFPEKVDRMVLDAVLDFNDWYSPRKDPRLDIADADLALNHFFTSCHAAGPDRCAAWAETPQGIHGLFLQADQQIAESPLPVPGYGLLKAPAWRQGAYQALYRPAEGFPLLAAVIMEILNSTAGPGVQGYFQATARPEEVPFLKSESEAKNGPSGARIIACSDADFSDVGTEYSPEEIVAEYGQVRSFFGGLASQDSLICLGAKLQPKARLNEKFTKVDTAHPILFIGNTADPTTPLRNAQRMASVFTGSRVLTINGTGHISYRATQNIDCAKEWIAPYLSDGTLPPDGTVCHGNQEFFLSDTE